MRANGDGRDWRLGVAWSVLVVLAIGGVLWPSLVAPALMMISPVAAAAFATPRAVASLAAVGVAFGASALVLGNDGRLPYLLGRVVAWTVIGVIAYLLARQRAAKDLLLAELATHDPLTGLANRRLLDERLDAQLSVRGRTGSAAVIYLDLDGFKAVNDRLGHPAGDAVLVAVAGRLHACVRAEDTVARVGGDEFVISCPDVEDGAGLTELCDRVLDALSRPVRTASGPVDVRATLGAVLVPRGARARPDDLVEAADQVLVELKASAPGTFRILDASAAPDELAT